MNYLTFSFLLSLFILPGISLPGPGHLLRSNQIYYWHRPHQRRLETPQPELSAMIVFNPGSPHVRGGLFGVLNSPSFRIPTKPEHPPFSDLSSCLPLLTPAQLYDNIINIRLHAGYWPLL
ncbi:hypothetical protein M422DRAFT_56344 [Sphaerobolus stellatus SS14]|uniref:Uncharacterized protein n=1 Tax=Sphaerobolus stellatus (strain SS14) TaxID=990650 RepID=A0A0C9U651_SPHS4|nr:hypothetical protein M422DRAFT_56344 [Sphaerobolus stellatus SS14]